MGVPVPDSGAASSNGVRLAASAGDRSAGSSGRRGRARGAQPPGLVAAKLTPPATRPGAVARTALLKRLRTAEAGVVLVVGPAGYGKTTLLAQWAAAETRRVAWLTCDARDNDPVVLGAHVAAALGSSPEPVLLVLDGVDCIQSRQSVAALAALIDRLPPAATVALSGRVPPRLPLAALHRRRGVQTIGAAELAFSGREARLLLAAGELDEEERDAVIEACEGWPAALSLAALSARSHGSVTTRPTPFSGTDRYLADYLSSEHLEGLRPAELRFLRRTAVLPELSAALCDAVLKDAGAKAALARIARSNPFLFPVEGRPGWFRVHGLLRDVLQRELRELEPRLAPALDRRAAVWHEQRGELEHALDHALAADDLDRVAQLVDALALPLSANGRLATVEGWLERLDERSLAHQPVLAVHACRVHALRGRAAEAERMLALAERGARRAGREATRLRPRLLVLRAALCRGGPRRMLADARAARALLVRRSRWHIAATELAAHALLLLGADAEADALLGETIDAAARTKLEETQMTALSQRSLLAHAHGDDARADVLAAAALELAKSERLAGSPTRALALAAAASSALHHRRWGEARELLAAAEPARALLTEALPWLAVGARLELARGYATLGDAPAAAALLDEADAVLQARPDLGVLSDQARALRRELQTTGVERTGDRFGLTPAELRLLPLLATHLSFREIADELDVSRNTVKTQAISIYRRLGVSGRSEAILKVSSIDRTHAAA